MDGTNEVPHAFSNEDNNDDIPIKKRWSKDPKPILTRNCFYFFFGGGREFRFVQIILQAHFYGL